MDKHVFHMPFLSKKSETCVVDGRGETSLLDISDVPSLGGKSVCMLHDLCEPRIASSGLVQGMLIREPRGIGATHRIAHHVARRD